MRKQDEESKDQARMQCLLHEVLTETTYGAANHRRHTLDPCPCCIQEVSIVIRGCSSLRSPSSTIQPAWTVSPVPGPSIVPVDNDPNWEDAPTTNPNTNLAANRPTSYTRSRSKLRQSDNTNKQLAEVLNRLANILNSNQTSGPNINSRGTKARIPDTFSGTEPDKLNNFLFQCHLYFHTNPVQFNMDIAKINFTMTYLTGVAQDWFEVGLNQEDQSILQDWLSNWNLFVDKLC